MITTSALVKTFTIAQTPATCNFPYSYTVTYANSGGSIVRPIWLTFEELTQEFKIISSLPTDVGFYTITTITSIP